MGFSLSDHLRFQSESQNAAGMIKVPKTLLISRCLVASILPQYTCRSDFRLSADQTPSRPPKRLWNDSNLSADQAPKEISDGFYNADGKRPLSFKVS